MTGRLDGRRIAITGAAQGIGAAIADACAREGASLYLLDLDAEGVTSVAARLSTDYPAARFAAAELDISRGADVARVFSQGAAEIGSFDGLINNAGVNVFHDPLETSEDEWRRCFGINLEGAWNSCRAVLPGMIEGGGGAIVNIASTHAFTIIPQTFPYPVAKHALLGMTRSLGLEYADKGVRVNAIAPGYVATQKVIDWWNDAPDPEAARAETMTLHPSGRIAEPSEIASAAVFMVSDECPFMNATCLTIDGGLSVRQHG
ncbi:SDR family oxidoreductase [Yangia mangrovi]|uniref:SDR family oxidoreductase n=1 Tax=Alloyangia mangrovi TaxID=1779329 RepID=A0A2A3JYL7_9RHOB|nr:SDR family oxidoreductase [Alloyangia mangrovi]MCT4370796.1 SDR family oxidoreductase [Alloyangia mangrovi]